MSFKKLDVGVSTDCSDTDRLVLYIPDDQAIKQILLDHKDVLAHRVIPLSRKGKPTTIRRAGSSISPVHTVRIRRKYKLVKGACN